MLDQSLVQSGFDAEILLGEKQLTSILLALVEAGQIPATITVGGTTLGLRGPANVDRTYTPDPNAHQLEAAIEALRPFEVEILFGQDADVRVHVVVDFQGAPVEGDLFVKLSLTTELDDAGMLELATLDVTVIDIESGILPFVESQFGLDKSEILAAIKDKVDRSVDLAGVGAFNRIHDIATQKLPAEPDHPAALGIYVNLRLRNGPQPDAFLPARGDLALARNFLPDGSDVAMASRAGIYADLASDGFNRFAEIDENGNVSHPWRKNPFNPKSEKRGKIIGVSVGPMPDTNPNTSTNTLKIDVEVEYEFDNFFDPNAHMVVELTPTTTAVGTLTWNVNVDYHGSLALEIIGFLALAGLVVVVAVTAGAAAAPAVAAGIVVGSLLDFGGHLLIDELFSARAERKADAKIPDVVSGRVEVAQRRWDPFYITHHQVGTRPDGALVNQNGIALWGKAVLDKQIKLIDHAVIRDKRVQSPNPPTHLRYRIVDAPDFAEDFEQLAPGTDRRPFGQHDQDAEPTLIELSIEEIEGRLAEGRILPNIPYVATHIDMRDNQVHSILAVSTREIGETRDGVIAAFEADQREDLLASEGAQIRMDVEAEFAATGRTPTPEGIEARIQEIITERITPAVEEFAEKPLTAETAFALRQILRFDLPPENLAALEKKKIFHLVGLQIITMRAPGHEGFMYYRDKPDFHKPDNLHSLPRYRVTPTGPEFL